MNKKDNLKDNLKGSLSMSKPVSAEEKEKDLERLMGGATNVKQTEEQSGGEKEKTRVTLDLSKPLARKVKTEAANRDQTMKGFIVDLLNRYFEEKSSK